jgi:type IV pilus assembly protein PilA
MKKNNNGFSLVELIIVIAIMAVLVGVLAPQFIKYVEQSRRSRDIQTAQEIRESILADIADGKITNEQAAYTTVTSTTATAMNDTPKASSTKYPESDFQAKWSAGSGTCEVTINGFNQDLCTTSGASNYKNS